LHATRRAAQAQTAKQRSYSHALSKNLYRCHLTDDQRATLAAEMVPMLEVEAKKRIGAGDQVVRNQTGWSKAGATKKRPIFVKVSKRKVKKARDGFSPAF
jgi:uncharacterized membrane-anchored protein